MGACTSYACKAVSGQHHHCHSACSRWKFSSSGHWTTSAATSSLARHGPSSLACSMCGRPRRSCGTSCPSWSHSCRRWLSESCWAFSTLILDVTSAEFRTSQACCFSLRFLLRFRYGHTVSPLVFISYSCQKFTFNDDNSPFLQNLMAVLNAFPAEKQVVNRERASKTCGGWSTLL